jgi:hypothetical protein
MAGNGLNLFAPEDVFMPIGMKAIGQHGESIVIRISIVLSARTTRVIVKETIQTAS